MFASTVTALIQAGFLAGMSRHRARFRRALHAPEAAQSERLRCFLRDNAETAYGRAHGYGSIASVREFQNRVPVVEYEALAPWVDRIAAGEPNVLTRAPVRIMERTSGSTAAGKLIPYTEELLGDFQAATGPWLSDLFASVPGLRGRRQYWSVSPAAVQRQRTSGGIPIGFEDDAEYFGPLYRAAISRLMAVRGDVARIPDVDAWRLETLRQLVECEDLSLLSVWSPSFLTVMMEELSRRLDEVVSLVSRPRAAKLRRGLDREGMLSSAALWPKLALISCWADGPSAPLVDGLNRWFPGVPVQGKGLLATEGVVSFPLWRAHEGRVLAVTSHFLEFIPVDAPSSSRPRLSHELRRGEAYSPLLTTGGGFARYHLKDIVRCVGFEGQTPLIRFDGKLDRVSDLFGEKLHVREVERALDIARGRTGARWTFALVAPSRSEPRRYCLFVESDLSSDALAQVARVMDDALSEGVHYGYCRRIGQLSPLQAVPVRQAWRRYERALVDRGMRAGDIKPTVLDSGTGWEESFARG